MNHESFIPFVLGFYVRFMNIMKLNGFFGDGFTFGSFFESLDSGVAFDLRLRSDVLRYRRVIKTGPELQIWAKPSPSVILVKHWFHFQLGFLTPHWISKSPPLPLSFCVLRFFPLPRTNTRSSSRSLPENRHRIHQVLAWQNATCPSDHVIREVSSSSWQTGLHVFACQTCITRPACGELQGTLTVRLLTSNTLD